MNSIMIYLLTVSSLCLAADRKPTQQQIRPKDEAPTVHVVPLEPGTPVEGFQNGNYQVHTSPPKVQQEAPPVELREKIFAEAGITAHIQKFDALDRDMLFIRAKRYKIEDLMPKYKHIPKAKLEKLRSLATKAKY